MSLIIPNCQLVPSGKENVLSLRFDRHFKEPLERLLQRATEKHNGYLALRLDLPHKPRTTGPFSQSHALHGYLKQLAEAYGTLSLEEMKQLMKYDCIEWPRKQIKLGGRVVEVPISESDADTVAESKAISWCHMRASELGLTLRED